MTDLTKEPALLEAVEEALAPYVPLHPPEVIAIMRRNMIEILSTHPYPAALVTQLNARRIRFESGEEGPADASKRSRSGS